MICSMLMGDPNVIYALRTAPVCNARIPSNRQNTRTRTNVNEKTVF